MDGLSSQLQAALYALHSHETSAQAESNAWLNEFLQSDESWNACIRLYENDTTPSIRSMCVSLLTRKVRMDWSGGWLTEQERAAKREQCKVMYLSQIGSASPDRLLIRQLVLLQVLCIEAEEHVRDLVQHAVEALSNSTMWYAGVEILLTIPNEFRESSRRVHGKLLPVLKAYTQMVLDAVDRQLLPSGGDDMLHRMSEVIRAWVELPSIPGGLPETDIIKFSRRHQNIFRFLVSECVDKGSEPACGALVACFKGTCPEDHADEAMPLFNGIISKMMSMKEYILQDSCEEQAMGVAQVGSGIADCWPEGIAYILPTCVDLAQIMLVCVKHPECTIVEVALDYFFALNLIDIRQRNEHLRHPVQAQLVESLAQRLMFPQSSDQEFLDMMAHDAGFIRLRKDMVPELLEEVYPSIGEWYLEWVLSGVKSSTWQEIEIALYLLQATDLQIRTRALAIPSQSDTSSALAREKINKSLCEAFAVASSFCRSNLCQESRAVASVLGSTFSTAVESFAIWFGKIPEAPFDEVFAAVLTILALNHPHSTRHACTAIKSLCVRLGRGLLSSENIVDKISLIKAGIAHLTLDAECEEELVEGMVHLATHLEPQRALTSLFDVISPYVDTIVHAGNIEYSSIDKNMHTKVMGSMTFISTALKALLSAAISQGGGWAAANLYKELHGCLAGFLQSEYCKNNSEAVDGVLVVCKEAIASSRKNSGEILQLVLPMVMGIFHESLSSPALDVLSEVIEMHFNDSDMMGDIVALSHTVFQKAFSVLHDQGLSSRPSLVQALLDVGYSFIVYAPNSIIQSGSLSVFIDLGIAALSCKEPEVIIKALQFLCYLPCAATDETIDQDSINTINANLIAKGPQLVESLMYAACETCPRSKVRSAANLIRALMLHPPLQGKGSAWLIAAISSERIQKVSKDVIRKESRDTFIHLATGGSLNPQRLTCLITDYGLVCRREEEESVFSIAYEV
ncbi:hypothetical protein M9434_005012 [Picochlorum sp. BPE23]|nr:hypothetical protein M9434_005012 [Picochlorum sp. BPE23]